MRLFVCLLKRFSDKSKMRLCTYKAFRARFARVSHEAILLNSVIGIFAKCGVFKNIIFSFCILQINSSNECLKDS